MSDYSNTHWMKDMPNEPEQSPLVVCNGCHICSPAQEYQPEILSIKKDLIYKLIPCLEAGLENTQCALSEHDSSLGRTTTKNRMWAEILEQEIQSMKDCIKQLKVLNVSNSTHYP